MNRWNADYYRALETRLRTVESAIARFDADSGRLYKEFLDHGEYGVAVEWVAQELLALDWREDFVPVVELLVEEGLAMDLDEAVASCRDWLSRGQ